LIFLSILILNLTIWIVTGFFFPSTGLHINPQLIPVYRLSLFFISVIIFLMGRFLILLFRNLRVKKKTVELIIYAPSIIISLIGVYMTFLSGSRREMLLFSIISLYYLIRHYEIMKKWT